jgi:hypothetical protein
MARGFEDQMQQQNHDELARIVREVYNISLQFFGLILNLESSIPPKIDDQKPACFNNARGFHAPFCLQFINS